MSSQQLALKDKNGAELVPMSDTGKLIEVIARAASDPAIDVEKLERLAGLFERVRARDAEQGFNESMTAVQMEMRRIAADETNPQTKSAYASYPALDKVLRPIYTKHGFSLSFDTGESTGPDMVRVLCHVGHTAGHSRTYKVDMPADGKGAKGGDVMTRTHATGAAFTYSQRYLLKLIFNIAVGDDDDGNSATAGDGPINAEQLDTIRRLIEQSGANVERFCAHFKIESIPTLRAKDYERAVESLNMKIKQVHK